MIRTLKESESPIWLEIAVEVESLFGPMVQVKGFQSEILKCIKSGNAFCVTTEQDIVAGIIAIDRTRNEIVWLAVKREFRGRNYGEKLVQKGIEELRDDQNVYVQTFAPGIPVGNGARHIYTKLGFVDLKKGGKNPAGIETTIMVRSGIISASP
jgi:ribosomal protein S18 acetylase RimI-like enzyme